MGKIKYHQNGTGNEYGEDHTLTNNWNPSLDYGNEYVNIHFRIEANYYRYPYNNYTQEQQQEFSNDAAEVFEALGWNADREGKGGYCTEISQGKQHLYLHPQDFSGEVLKNNVKQIAEALENNKTFKLEWVDLYETVYDITDQEYEEYLTTKDNEIRTAIFDKCQTARTNKFYYIFDAARSLSPDYRLTRIGLNDGRNYGSGQTIEHITKIIEQMINENYLISTTDQKGYKLVRSINKTEQKKLKLNVA
jgi:hypothetical protein